MGGSWCWRGLAEGVLAGAQCAARSAGRVPRTATRTPCGAGARRAQADYSYNLRITNCRRYGLPWEVRCGSLKALCAGQRDDIGGSGRTLPSSRVVTLRPFVTYTAPPVHVHGRHRVAYNVPFFTWWSAARSRARKRNTYLLVVHVTLC